VLIRDFKEITRTKTQVYFPISFVVAIWAASGALSAAMNALDQIHQIPQRRVRSASSLSLGLTIGTIMLLMTASFLVFVSDWLLRLFVLKSFLSYWLFGMLGGLCSWVVSAAFGFVYRGPSRWNSGTR